MKRDLDDAEHRLAALSRKVHTKKRQQRHPRHYNTASAHSDMFRVADGGTLDLGYSSFDQESLNGVLDPLGDGIDVGSIVGAHVPDAQDSLFERAMMGSL